MTESANLITDVHAWAEAKLAEYVRTDADTGRRSITVDAKYLFSSIDDRDTQDALHEVVQKTLSDRPLFAPSRDEAERFYAQLLAECNRKLIEDHLSKDEFENAFLDEEERADKEGFTQADMLAGFLADIFNSDLEAGVISYTGKRYEPATAIFNVARKAVQADNPVHVFTNDIDAVDFLAQEINDYGNDALEAVWFAPLQADNHNTEGQDVGFFIDELYQLMQECDNEELSIAERTERIEDVTAGAPEVITHLFASQGYEISDLMDETIRKNSTFLHTFAQEMENLPGTGGYAPLAFITTTVGISARDLNAIMSGKANAIVITAPNQTNPGDYNTVGLFDPTMGGGSLMDVELERDWIIPVTPQDLRGCFAGMHLMKHNDYGYSPDQVYGYGPHYFPTEARVVRLP